jgi:hypothetical protein
MNDGSFMSRNAAGLGRMSVHALPPLRSHLSAQQWPSGLPWGPVAKAPHLCSSEGAHQLPRPPTRGSDHKMATGEDLPPLQDGWSEVLDAEGDAYYWNESTGEVILTP